jgi:hypothetical protein
MFLCKLQDQKTWGNPPNMEVLKKTYQTSSMEVYSWKNPEE